MKRTVLAAAVAALFAGAAQAAVTEFIIYQHPNYQGEKQVIKGEVNILESGFAGKGSSIKVLGGHWEVCTEHHFRGDCYVLKAGDYPWLGILDDRIAALRFLGERPSLAGRQVLGPASPQLAQSEVPALKRQAQAPMPQARGERIGREERREAREEWRERRERRFDASIDLYGQTEFRGRSVRVDDNIADLGEVRFDGRASSVIVHEGTWQLCTEPGYRGRCSVLRPGEYPQLAALDDRVSSVRRLY